LKTDELSTSNMSRYQNIQIIRDENTKRKFSFIIHPVMPFDQRDITIQTTSAERLDKLALTFYGDVSKWWVIAAANGLGKGTLIVPTNTRLRIPYDERIDDVVIEKNSTR
jgi:hypothetical protein